MGLSPPVAPPREIGLYWNDEEICSWLEGLINGYPYPDNVIDLNPFQYKPSNLPEGLWCYSTTSEENKCSEGCWKANGEPCMIVTDTIIGSRTTFEFYEGSRKTDWVMQEYKITQKGQSKSIKSLDSKSLCRVFQVRGQNSNNEMKKKLVAANVADGKGTRSVPSVVSNGDKNTGQSSDSKSLSVLGSISVINGNGETGPLDAPERLPNHPIDYPLEMDYFSGGDFLELLDLDNPMSSSSSSDNSSCLSQCSDESFDSLTLLRDLEPDIIVGCKKSVVASVIPDNVVLQPANSGSDGSNAKQKLQAEEPSKGDGSLLGSAVEEKLHKKKGLKRASISKDADNKVESPSSNSHSSVGSARSEKAAASDGKGKPAVGKKKKLKKYFCFMPF